MNPNHLNAPLLGGAAAAEQEGLFDDVQTTETFATYSCCRIPGSRSHPDTLIESSSLAGVQEPPIVYEMSEAIRKLMKAGDLSGPQIETVLLSCQKHERFLNTGDRCGFFLGDGAGVGKGRQARCHSTAFHLLINKRFYIS